MERITKANLQRQLDRLNRAIDGVSRSHRRLPLYGLYWANGTLQISYGDGETLPYSGTKREIYQRLLAMCHVAERL